MTPPQEPQGGVAEAAQIGLLIIVTNGAHSSVVCI